MQDRAVSVRIVLSLYVTLLMVLTSFVVLPAGSGVQAKVAPLEWGSIGQVTDKEDFYIDDIGNAIGYLDKKPVVEEHNGRLYVAWETSERKMNGSMVYVRALGKDGWGPIRVVAGKEDGVIDTEPVLASYKGGLYLVWQHAGGTDTEIMCQVLEDGDWTSCGEVSQVDDFRQDYSPALAVHDDLLWAAWVTKSPVTGLDPANGDVVIRSFDGTGWSKDIPRMSRTPANGYDDHPRLASYGGALVAVWETRDPKVTNGTDSDIVLREFRAGVAGDFVEVTEADGTDDDDTFPVAEMQDDLLFIAWQSDGDKSTETDIRYATYDGSKVSSERLVNPGDNMAWDEHPELALYGGVLYCAWNSNDAGYTDGGDDDIVISVWDDGGWSGPEEITTPDLSGHDHEGHSHGHAALDRYPVMEEHDGILFVVWERDDQRTVLVDPGDIMYRRSPPEDDTEDELMTILVLLLGLAILVGIVLVMFGPRRTAREERYLKRRRSEDRRRMAMSRAGGGGGKGKSRGGRKGGKGRKRKGKKR